MKRLLTQSLLVICGILCIFTFLHVPTNVYADTESEPVNIYLFYGEGCPHCKKEREFLKALKTEYGDSINIYEYELYYNEKNTQLFMEVTAYIGIQARGVPFIIVGERYFEGYSGDSTTGQDIKTEIDRCMESGCTDYVSAYIAGTPISELKKSQILPTRTNEQASQSPIYLDTKLFGKIDLKSISLPIATIIIGFLDGFNPCAMWILIFLITMLINMKDKKKLFILGSTFIVTSGVVYLFFLAAWFSLFQLTKSVTLIKVIIGIVAIISGIVHIKSSLSTKGGCKVTNKHQRKSIMERIKSIIKEKSFIISMLGIITLAISVNIIEVACSAGLPAVYTNLLSTINLNPVQYYLYLLLYVFVFMLDDLIIFYIAIKSFEVTGISKKYTKWSGLIGGIIILILGIILILKPELLMFG